MSRRRRDAFAQRLHRVRWDGTRLVIETVR